LRFKGESHLLTSVIVRLVDASRRNAWLVIVAALALAVGCSWFAVTHFKINTDVDQLLSENLDWRKQEKAMSQAFPQKSDRLVVVFDGATPEIADSAATMLPDRLSAMPDYFTMVERPDSIPFFQKNGLLFLSRDEISERLDQMSEAQPMIAMLSSDPSLRGYFGTMGLMVMGFEHGAVGYDKLDRPFSKTTETIEAAMNGEDKPLPLSSLISNKEQLQPRDLRKFILTKPVLNYSDLSPGQRASDALRAAAKEIGLTPDHGVRVRLTGSVALSDEEFASVANGTGFATMLSGGLVFMLLLIALRSLRIIIPIILTLLTGLAATTAFALLAVHALNLISVAFAVMFIGIAVDFGIQFGIRYRDQHFHEPDHAKAMVRTAGIIAVPLSMAAGSTSLGFLCFIPTEYRGVSELGLIAGAGMIIAFALNITLLPALMELFRPPAEREVIGYRWAAPIDQALLRHRPAILAVAVLLAVVGLAITTQLRFDFDPLNLKDPKTESVSTLFDLMADPQANSYTIDILRPNLQAAQSLASDLSKLPEVDHVMTLASFVPDDQDAKLALISETNTLLSPSLALGKKPPASDDDVYVALQQLVPGLHQIGKDHPSAEQLGAALDKVIQKHDPALLQRLQKNLIAPMQARLSGIQSALGAQKVDTDTITADLKKDWITPDGRALVEVYPKGNARDHETIVHFTDAVRVVAPDATGAPISIRESGNTIVSAFIHAGSYAVAAIALLAFLVLRNIRDVVLLLTPLILAGILSLATMVVVHMPLNFANIIALPLLLSLGVSYAIYFVSYWRAGMTMPLQSSMARAVLFSAATVLVAFGSLALSSHPGTAGMGELLTVALVYSVLSTFFILPSLLGPIKKDRPFI